MTDDYEEKDIEKCDISDVKKIIIGDTHIHTAPGYVKAKNFPAVHKYLPDTLDPNLVRDNKQKNRRTDPDMYDVEDAVEIGERIRDVVVRKLKTAKENMVNDVPLMHDVSTTALPLRRVTETDKLRAEENIKRYIERLGRDYYDAYDLRQCTLMQVY